MNYWEAKAERNRALIASIHGGPGAARTAAVPGMLDSVPYGEPRTPAAIRRAARTRLRAERRA